MAKKIAFLLVLFFATIIMVACDGSDEPSPTPIPMTQTAVPTIEPAKPASAQEIAQAFATIQAEAATPESEVITTEPTVDYNLPTLHQFGEQPAVDGPGQFDIGVNNNQVGIIFGWSITWPSQGLGAGNGCQMVILAQGWYENVQIEDGRYEVYNLPSSDPEGWSNVLVTERANEQSNHYSCPNNYKHINIWKEDGSALSWSIPSSATATQTTPSAPSTETTNNESVVQASGERQITGQNMTLQFKVGDEVWGWAITYKGISCTGGGCYIESALESGEVTSGVINPFGGEVVGELQILTP